MNKAFVAVTVGAVGLLVGIFILANSNSSPSTNDQSQIKNPHEIREVDHVAGNPQAKATLIEYGDFQCPACAAAHPLVTQLKEDMGDQVAIVFRHFPLTNIHPNALPAAQAAEAAGRQGKFWEMHDLLFERQQEWSQSTAPVSFFNDYARELGLDLDQFGSDMDDPAILNRINDNRGIANQLGVSSTPTFYLNGQQINNPATYDQLKSQVESALEPAEAN